MIKKQKTKKKVHPTPIFRPDSLSYVYVQSYKFCGQTERKYKNNREFIKSHVVKSNASIPGTRESTTKHAYQENKNYEKQNN